MAILINNQPLALWEEQAETREWNVDPLRMSAPRIKAHFTTYATQVVGQQGSELNRKARRQQVRELAKAASKGFRQQRQMRDADE